MTHERTLALLVFALGAGCGNGSSMGDAADGVSIDAVLDSHTLGDGRAADGTTMHDTTDAPHGGGDATMDTGPVCKIDGDACAMTSQCCSGLTCTGGVCVNPAPMCTTLGDMCDPTSLPCCGSAICAVAPSPPTICCVGAGYGCASSAVCCGQMLCANGICQCREMGQSCVSDEECCPTLHCLNNSCG